VDSTESPLYLSIQFQPTIVNHSPVMKIINLFYTSPSPASGGGKTRRALLSLLCLLHLTLAAGQTTWMGMTFTVGSTPVSINSLGRLMAPGNSASHQLKLVQASDGQDVPGSAVNISMAGGTVGSFKYASLPQTVTLHPNTTYYLVSSETQGGDSWYGATTSVATTDVASCNGGVFWDGGGWTVHGGRNNMFVPVSFTYGPRDPDNVTGTSNGLDYAYYEFNTLYNQGDEWWQYLPELSSLSPLRTGTKTNFEISGNSRADNFIFRFTGYIDVPATGTYTFYTFADDACDLYIGGALVVFNKSVSEKSGKIDLKAGKHAISVVYTELRSAQILHHVRYEGPGVAKQNIPSDRLHRGGTVSSAPAPVAVVPTQPVQPVQPAPVPASGGFSGFYHITAKHSGKVVDVANESLSNGARVFQWVKNGGHNQHWSLLDAGDGYYRIVVRHSGKSLSVSNSISEAQQLDYTGTDTQKWLIESTGDGFYKLTNKGTGQVLDVNEISQADGARIQQWAYNGGDNQKWRLEQVSAGARAAADQTDPAVPEMQITLFPNPATDKVQINFNAGAAGQGKVTVSNATSRQSITRDFSLHTGSNVINLDVSSLQTGIYFLHFAADGKEATRKLVVTK
jgi:hypothetical protein